MPFAIEGLESILAGDARRSSVLRTSALGLLIAWLHPWQGETLIAVGAGLALLGWHDRRRREDRTPRTRTGAPGSRARPGPGRLHRPGVALACAATAAPIVYYAALSELDRSWRVSEQASVGAARIPWPVLVTCIAPLALVLAIASQATRSDARLRPLLLWGLCCMATVGLSFTGQYHALDGLALPLGVLAVAAWPRRHERWRRLVSIACVLLALAPTAGYAVRSFARLHDSSLTQYTELERADVRAAAVAAGRAGGRPVLAPVALGTAIPALTGAVSWVGHPIWTPDHLARELAAERLFSGEAAPEEMHYFVLATGAAAIVEPCAFGGEIEAELSRLGYRRLRVGCARVFVR